MMLNSPADAGHFREQDALVLARRMDESHGAFVERAERHGGYFAAHRPLDRVFEIPERAAPSRRGNGAQGKRRRIEVGPVHEDRPGRPVGEIVAGTQKRQRQIHSHHPGGASDHAPGADRHELCLRRYGRVEKHTRGQCAMPAGQPIAKATRGRFDAAFSLMFISTCSRDRVGPLTAFGGNGATAFRGAVDAAGRLAKKLRLVCL